MKTLKGTEKQIKWAEDIRQEWIDRVAILEDDSHITEYTETVTVKDPLMGMEQKIERSGIRVSEQMKSVLQKANHHFEPDVSKKALAHHTERIELARKIREVVENENRATAWINIR